MSVTLNGPQLSTLRAVFGAQIPGDVKAAFGMLESSPLAPADAAARTALQAQIRELAGQHIDTLRAAGESVAASRPSGTGQRALPASLGIRLAQMTGSDALQGARASKELTSVLSLAQAKQAAELLKNRADIPWSFIDEGCMYRAHYGAWLLEQAGFKTDKIVSHSKNGGDLRLNSAAHPAGFSLAIYHMALSIVVNDGGELKRKVIDPAFSDEPMDVAEWHSHMQAPRHGPLETYFMPRFVEMPWQLAENAPTGWTEDGLDAARDWHNQIQQHPFFTEQKAWCAELVETWKMMEARVEESTTERPAPALTEAQRKALLSLGVPEADLERVARGEEVVVTRPTRAGHDTIGTVQLAEDHVKSTILSVHHEGEGRRAMAQLRSDAMDVARAFGRTEIELGGAAVVNPRVEGLLKRQGFSRSIAPVPDDLGNEGTLTLYTRRMPVPNTP